MIAENHTHSHPRQLRMAIVESNVLACMGLQSLLAEFFPMVEIIVCDSFHDLQQHEEEDMFVHYFISSRIYFEHAAYFRTCRGRSIVMVNGDMSITGVATLNVCQSQASIISDLIRLQAEGHQRHTQTSPHVMAHATADDVPPSPSSPHLKADSILSPREVEVALLLCRGFINKEVADKLNIGLTTVITHRKNIMEKLHAKSLADVIVYCVLNGIYTV